jgi:AraC-like DNA-binding protein
MGPGWTFTTRTIPPHRRRDALHALAERGLVPVRPLAGHTATVELVKWRLPDLSIMSGTFAGVSHGGDRADGDVFFGINVGGTGHARQDRHRVTIEPGSAVLADPRGGRFTIDRPDPNRLVGMRLPRRTLGLGADPVTLRVVPAGTPALLLLTRYVAAMDEHVADSLAHPFARHLAELIALSLRPPGTDPPPAAVPGIRAARLCAIKADIDRHLTDGSLTAAAVAARHRISTRYLHKLFADDALTFSRFLLDRRLDLAHARLRDPRFTAATVSRIASDAGFGDLSYFNRTFRRRFGRTPSDVRAPC